jgi:multimeric flavodoxin WrbA
MRVIGFVGSPRESGNTATLVRRILDGAASAGADMAVFYLNDLNIRGCQACMYCKTHDGCKQEDDMIRLIEEIKGADRIVIGSPIYIGYVSGQTKTFLDRLYVFFTGPTTPGKMPPGKKAALVFSQGNPDEQAFTKYIEIIPGFLGRLGMEITDTLLAAGIPNAADNEALMQKAFEVGAGLAR